MPRPGSHDGLLDGLHATDCNGTEYSALRPVANDGRLVVVYLAWCGECGAADYDEVN